MTAPEASGTEDDIQFAIAYAPPSYDFVRSGAQGMWTELSIEGTNIGVLWTDNQNGVGLIPNGEGLDHVSRVGQQLAHFAGQKVPADVAYQTLKLMPGTTTANERDGDLDAVLAILLGKPLTAAGEAEALPAVPAQSIWAAYDNDDFVGVGMSRPDGLYVRDNGAWVKVPDDDLRFDGLEWLDIDEATVKKYDKLEREGKSLPRSEVEGAAADS